MSYKKDYYIEYMTHQPEIHLLEMFGEMDYNPEEVSLVRHAGRIEFVIDEACFRWNTRKMCESERFTDMFTTSIGLVKPNKEFKLCMAA